MIRTVADLIESLEKIPFSENHPVKFEALTDLEQGDLVEAQGVDLRLSMGGVIVTLGLLED